MLLFSSSCSVLQEECEKNNTGTFYVTNNSQTGKAYKILIDGINYDIVETYKDFGGIRIEDDILVTENGARVLGKPIPKTVAEIEKTMKNEE